MRGAVKYKVVWLAVGSRAHELYHDNEDIKNNREKLNAHMREVETRARELLVRYN